jgi:Tfp pilus assembly protein FimT
MASRTPTPGTFFRSREGFTLVEMGFVLFMIGLFSAIGWGSIQDDLPRFRMIDVAKGLASDIDELRTTAINLNLETRILLESTDPDEVDPASYGGAWRRQAGNSSNQSSRWEDLPVDANRDGSDDERGLGPVDLGVEGNRRSKGVGLADWGALTGPGAGNANAIVFTPRGWVANPASDFDSQGYITLTLVNKVALQKGLVDEIHVRIARSGYIRLESTLAPAPLEVDVGTDGSSIHGS